MTTQPLQPLGKHFYRIEDDIVYIQFHRNVELQETVEFTKIFEQVYAQHHHLLMLNDLLKATLIDADARKYFGTWAKNIQMMATASVGANMLQKAISVFMHNAVKLFSKGHFAQAFYDNEAEARSWLQRQRTVFDQIRSKSPS